MFNVLKSEWFFLFQFKKYKGVLVRDGVLIKLNTVSTLKLSLFKGIVCDSNSIFLWHKSEDINKK